MKQKILSLVLFLTVLAGTSWAWAAESGSVPLAPIQITAERRQLIGVRFATVQHREVTREIDTTGNVEPDEQLQSYVQTRFAGWIQQVFVNQTYQRVSHGQALFTVYSPDLASTEQEYLLALRSEDRVANSPVAGVADGARSLTSAAAERLALFGVPRSEVVRLKRERAPQNLLTVYSPAAGYVVERNALPNMYVQPKTKLYSITDFSTVWVYAAVFQDEIGGVQSSDPAVLTIDAYPGERFDGRVDYIWPEIDAATRTARVRLAFANRAGKLKPGMYGRVMLRIPMGEQTVIPASGVLRTGTRNVAFVDRGDGYLTPTEVELGSRAGDDLIVLKGLEPGEKIVASANFLIDSESQLQAAAGSFAPQPPGVGANEAQPVETANQPTAVLKVATIPSSPARGKNQVRVTLTDSHGKAIDDAQVTVTFFMAAMPAMGMTAMRESVSPAAQGGGIYQGNVDLESGGTWQVTAAATKDGKTLATKQFNVSVAGGM